MNVPAEIALARQQEVRRLRKEYPRILAATAREMAALKFPTPAERPARFAYSIDRGLVRVGGGS